MIVKLLVVRHKFHISSYIRGWTLDNDNVHWTYIVENTPPMAMKVNNSILVLSVTITFLVAQEKKRQMKNLIFYAHTGINLNSNTCKLEEKMLGL